MAQNAQQMNIYSRRPASGYAWKGIPREASFLPEGIHDILSNTDKPCTFVEIGGKVGASNAGTVFTSDGTNPKELKALAFVPANPPEEFGDEAFRQFHGCRYAYVAGAMAGGIASAEMVIALGKAGIMSIFGAGGLPTHLVEKGIKEIQAALPDGPYGCNLIHSPNEEALERGAVDLYLKYGVHTVSASAYLGLTKYVVYYRAAGLSRDAQGNIVIGNKILAKISRLETATHFMKPAPEAMLTPLVQQGLITPEQAEMAQQVPMCDDVIAEADSGGHTDNRPMPALLPSIITLRDEIQQQYNYPNPIRVGGAGGIGTPAAGLAAFMMGASFILTGSVNQGCLEADSSMHTKKLLAQAEMTDVMMAPAADMFELGVKLQVLKRGTMFGVRAQKLYDIYREYNSIEDIPADERARLEKTIFRTSMDDIWQGTVDFFTERDPEQIHRAEADPHKKMALIFRWYLGLSSRWSNNGEKGRELDYQIWCGPAMGAFNQWVRGTYLEEVENRRVVDVAEHIMRGVAYLYRVRTLESQGLVLPVWMQQYRPEPLA